MTPQTHLIDSAIETFLPILPIAYLSSNMNFVSPLIQSDDEVDLVYFLMVSVAH